MSFLTSLARSWLTRSLKPFTFKSDYDQVLPYENLDNLGLYVHLPFCKNICNFCPYCKKLYSEEESNKYINALIKEIHIVGSQSKEKKKVTSLYFGGGTPALSAPRIHEIIEAINEHFIITEGIGLELHPDNVNKETLQTLKDAGVTKISIGIQSFRPKYQSILGRKTVDTKTMKEALEAVPFETVSMDFIFALPSQTYEDLEADVDEAFELGANHVAIYPFIDFTFTSSKVKALPKKEKRELLDAITKHCQEKGYPRSTIWTFSNKPEAKYSSMTRETFLGFGCSATTLLKDQFKINTFDVDSYIKRIEEGKLPTSLTIRFESEKARPAVVVAVPDGVNVLLAEMTSKRGKDQWAVYVGKEHILQGELSGYPAWIWTSQLFTAARSVIGQKVARIKRIKMDEVRQRIVALATKVNF